MGKIKEKQDQQFQSSAEKENSDHIRAARLKQADAMREAVKISNELEEQKPKKKVEEKKKPTKIDFVPFGSKPAYQGGRGK